MTFKISTCGKFHKKCKALDRAGIEYDTNFDQDARGDLINCEIIYNGNDPDWIDYLN